MQACAAIYCEEKNCYEILGLESPMAFSTPATETEIKKAYRKLSLKWHPDKCKEDAKVCEANFIEVANAYTILSSKEQRKNYDYFLEHPEAYGHSARYYKTMMAPEVPFWVVVVGFVAIVSAIQWPLAWQQYRWAQKWAKQSETYKVRAAKMLEAQGMDETAAGVDDGVELELTGYPKPKWQVRVARGGGADIYITPPAATLSPSLSNARARATLGAFTHCAALVWCVCVGPVRVSAAAAALAAAAPRIPSGAMDREVQHPGAPLRPRRADLPRARGAAHPSVAVEPRSAGTVSSSCCVAVGAPCLVGSRAQRVDSDILLACLL